MRTSEEILFKKWLRTPDWGPQPRPTCSGRAGNRWENEPIRKKEEGLGSLDGTHSRRSQVEGWQVVRKVG